MPDALTRIFAAQGPLAAQVPSYRPRPQQLEMAQAILAAIESGGSLAVEAGTGTGKTFAYLVPALLAGGKVIVSTGTKTLQNQLYDRDLPAVRDALAGGSVPALLKGRANYVCLHRLERARSEGRLESRADARGCLIEHFAATTQGRPRRSRRVPRTHRSGSTPPRRARIASARIVRTTGTAS